MLLNKTSASFFLLCILVFSAPSIVLSDSTAELTVVPVVVDEKAKARDILKKSITITNTTQRKLNLYPAVNDVQAEAGQEAFVSSQGGDDEKDSLANWIEISRGVIDLMPGESREIPFVIRVSLNALPGTYHADISFYAGSTVAEAQARNPLGVVTVNTEVQADIKESMQLNKFISDGFFFSGDDVLFNYQLENIGNQELRPKGEIRIYDRKGREVASIPVNPEGKSFTPDQAAQLASAWSAAKGFGKFKAFLNVDYGNNQSGSLQDTVFFWIIPWQQLLAIAVISIMAIVVSAIYFHRWLEHRHMQRFALAGAGAGMQGGAAVMQPPAGMLTPSPQQSAQITAVMPVAPHAEEKPKKKGFFQRFRRAKKDAETDKVVPVAPLSQTAPQTVEQLVAPAVAYPGNVTVRSADAPVPRADPAPHTAPSKPGGRTIDLTSHKLQSAERKSVGNVINLKGGA